VSKLPESPGVARLRAIRPDTLTLAADALLARIYFAASDKQLTVYFAPKLARIGRHLVFPRDTSFQGGGCSSQRGNRHAGVLGRLAGLCSRQQNRSAQARLGIAKLQLAVVQACDGRDNRKAQAVSRLMA